MKTESKIQYYGIDLIKLLMAVCVIAIHTNPLVSVDNRYIQGIYGAVTEQAVPFFFLSSSFFLFSGFDGDLYAKENLDRVKKFAVRMLQLYLLWQVVYLPISVYAIVTGASAVKAVFAFVRNLFFFGAQWFSWQLWYQLSSIYAAVFLLCALKWKIKEKWIYLLSAALYSITLIVPAMTEQQGAYRGAAALLCELVSGVVVDGRVFSGIGLFALGLYHIRSRRHPKNRQLLLVLWLAMTAGLAVLRSTSLALVTDLWEIGCSYVLFLCAAAFFGPDARWSNVCRKASTVFYYTHMIWYFIGGLILYGVSEYGVGPFLWTMALSALAAAAAWMLRDRKIVRVLFG